MSNWELFLPGSMDRMDIQVAVSNISLYLFGEMLSINLTCAYFCEFLKLSPATVIYVYKDFLSFFSPPRKDSKNRSHKIVGKSPSRSSDDIPVENRKFLRRVKGVWGFFSTP